MQNPAKTVGIYCIFVVTQSFDWKEFKSHPKKLTT